MASYTRLLRDIVNDSEFDIGLRDYPFPDDISLTRDDLNSMIIGHYLMREIGFETEELFRQAINQRMNEIMGFYSKLLVLADRSLDDQRTHDLYTETETSSNAETLSTTEATSKSSGDGENRAYSMPSQQLRPDVEDYFDSATQSESTSDSSTDSNASGSSVETARGATHSYGRSGLSEAEAVMLAYAATRNVVLEIISELADLFMGVLRLRSEYGMF